MERQTRTSGGAKNEKSGKQWSKEELREVLDFYLNELKDGIGIHESNPDLIKAAKKLGREARSFENQLRQFKDLEKNGENSTMHIGNNCKEVWKDQMEKETKDNDSLWTFSGIFEEYLSLRPELEGRENDINRFQNYLKEDFGDREPSEVVPEDISLFTYNLENLYVKPSTVGHVLELLERLANYAFKKKFCPGLSFKIQMPTVENQKTENNPALKEKVKKEPGKNNDFLSKLLHLQQDGNEAISAPNKWLKEEPLLKIETLIDQDVNDIVENMLLVNNSNTIARWHFFIGSPGNGKSAAIGDICRKLREKYACRIVDVNGVSIDEIDDTNIPYELNVFEKIGTNEVYSAMIIQDASVVRKPYAKDVDPSKDLLKSVDSAYKKGVSLLVCTNRGVIEKSIRIDSHEKSYSDEAWFSQLDDISKEITPSNKPRSFGLNKTFEKYIFKASYLDNSSLLNESKSFEDLIIEATKDSNWIACNGCEVINLCPFRSNRNWLADKEARGKFLSVLKRAEVFSGQIIVFREALALISFLLAGCPIDYENITPCGWVIQKNHDKDIFALGMRRIYMSIFSSFSPYGLEYPERLNKIQCDMLKEIKTELEDSTDSWHHLQHVTDQNTTMSTDVGVARLIGPEGVMRELDASFDGMDKVFLDNWDSDNFDNYLDRDIKHFTEIERECLKTWIKIEKIIESSTILDSPRCYQTLRKWSSNFLLHFGMLLEGKTSWSDELEDFIKVLGSIGTSKEERTREQKKVIREVNKDLESLLAINAGGIQSDSIELSEYVKLKGDYIKKLKPEINNDAVSKGPFINIKFLNTKSTLSARAFIMQKRHKVLNLDPACFPKEVFIGMIDARILAASSNNIDGYALQEKDVVLLIKDLDGNDLKLERDEWEVFLDE